MKRLFFALGIILSIQSEAQTNIKNPFSFFKGYKVDTIALKKSRQKDFGKNYWKNTGVPGDLIVDAFQSQVGFFQSISFGDFNNDGWIDVFNGGSRYQVTLSISTFLIWNPEKNKFEKKNLYNNLADSIFGGNKNHTIPVYLNDDNYVDFVIFDNGDEWLDPSIQPNEPIRLVLSDGKGKYDVVAISTNEKEPLQNMNHKGGGDVGDLNGDGIPDLVIGCGPLTYIYWGIKSFPFFSQEKRACFPYDNGFGETTKLVSRSGYAVIDDINNDGANDIIMAGVDDPPNTYSYIMFNQGSGRFNDNGVVALPINTNSNVANEDYAIDDLNNDGLKDIISLNHDLSYNNWNFSIYSQQKNGSFVIDSTSFIYNINKTKPRFGGTKFMMFYQDINLDGKKDVGYYEGADNPNQFVNRSIFIRQADKFVESGYYQYDSLAQTIIKYYDYIPFDNFCNPTHGQPAPINLTKAQDANYYFICPGDSTKITLLSKNNGDKFSWILDEKIDSASTALNNITITKASTLKVIRTDSLGCKVDNIITFTEPYTTPNTPLIKDTVICQFATPFSLSPFVIETSDYGLKWFGQDSLAISGSNTPSIVNTNDSGNRKYYVSMYNYVKVFDNSGNYIYKFNTCYGPKVPVKVKINPAPATPSVKDTAYCNNISADTLKATSLTGHSLNWYGTSATGGTGSILGSKPATTTVGSFSYYVSQKNNSTGCEGVRAKIGVTINPLPIAPVVRDTNYCNNASADTIRLNASTGATFLWYGTNATGGTSSTIAIKPTTATVGTANYYLSQIITATGCEGPRSKVVVTTKPIPSAPILTRDTANFLLSGAPGTTWYKDGVAITDTAQKYKPTTAGSYTAKTTTNGCTSAMSTSYYYLVTDIINLSKDEFIKLAPNPFVNQINFDFVVKGYQRLNLEVFDIASGTKVASQPNLTAGTKITLGQLSAGTYVIKVTSTDNKISYQFKMVKL